MFLLIVIFISALSGCKKAETENVVTDDKSDVKISTDDSAVTSAEEEKTEDIAKSYEGYPDFIIPPKAEGKEIFVAKNGASTNDGTKESPYNTIAKAVNVAKPGDTIYIREGTYKERLDISKANEEDKWIVIKNYNNEKVILDDNYGSNDSCFVFRMGAKYWKLEGLTIRKYTGAAVWAKNGAEYIYMENLDISDISNKDTVASGTQGILGSAKNVLVRNCHISDIGTFRMAQHDHGIYLGSPENWVIDSNKIERSPGSGIQMYPGEVQDKTVGKNVYITNNIIQNCLHGLILVACENFVISNNTFYNNWEACFYILYMVKDCRIQNNIFYYDYPKGTKYKAGLWNEVNIKDRGVQPLFIESSVGSIKDNTFENNIVYFKNYQMQVYYNSNFIDFEDFIKTNQDNQYIGFILQDPLLRNPAEGDFTPIKESPAAGGGVKNEFTPEWDIDKNLRSNADIGACIFE